MASGPSREVGEKTKCDKDVDEVSVQHVQEKDQLQNTIRPLPVEKETLMKRELEQRNAELDKYCKEMTEKHAKEIDQLHNQIACLNSENQNVLKRDYEQSKNLMDKLRIELTEKHAKDTDELLKNIDRLNVEKDNLLKRERKQTKKELDKLRKELDEKHAKETDQLLKSIDRLNVEKEHVQKTTREQEEKNLKNLRKELDEKHARETDQLLKNIDRLNEEKDNLLKRLSALAGERLTHENPNIVDLSDEDRPTKLQEVYGELYDNEWTDAFEELTKNMRIPEKDAIMILLNILIIAFHKCRTVTWCRYERLIQIASTIDIEEGIPLSFANMYFQNYAKEKTEIDNTRTNETPKDQWRNGKEKTGEKEDNESANADMCKVSKDRLEDKILKNIYSRHLVSGHADQELIAPELSLKHEHIEKKGEIWIQGDQGRKSQREVMENSKDQMMKGAEETLDTVNSRYSGTSTETHESNKGPKGMHAQCKIDLSFHALNSLKDIWRTSTNQLNESSAKAIYSNMETCLNLPVNVIPKTATYLKRCVDFCWKMGVQEKPLHLVDIAEKDANFGNRFDTDKFRYFTRNGQKVAFVVWPALYLYEGGPMLVKGIAQGC